MRTHRNATPREVVESLEQLKQAKGRLDRDEENALFEARIQIGTVSEAGAELHAAWADFKHEFLQALRIVPIWKVLLIGAAAGTMAFLLEQVVR